LTDRQNIGRRLILILGDQLAPDLTALAAADPARDIVLMVEARDEATYVRHHKKKIALVLAAMRHFASELAVAGWEVDYVKLDDPENSGSLTNEVFRALDRHDCQAVSLTEPGEWRLRQAFEALTDRLDVPLDILEDDRFICGHAEFERWADGRKELRMENFYREMRRRTGLLMDGDAPAGGRWNYDSENRKPPGPDLEIPPPRRARPDKITREVLDLVAARFDDHFGDLEPFWFAVTRHKAEQAFTRFVDERLAAFGDYQDAMQADEPFVFHGLVGLHLNLGLLDPLAVCRRVESAYRNGDVPLNAADGFIRQIIGWREYVRGIYWRQGPDYADENFFGHTRELPDFYWNADTEMSCIRACVSQTRAEAYAHHIQRLMVTGNFAMLAGVRPAAVHEWYLAVYADAYEWVELPNTLGMSQFADGGLLASKPYAASGNYINKMSDYCGTCRYSVTRKTGDKACPFNYLYWNFLDRHRDKLESNHRLGRAYAIWDRFDDARRATVRTDADAFLAGL
jgi:deoxyribodipyrimidine photolyase-related protein